MTQINNKQEEENALAEITAKQLSANTQCIIFIPLEDITLSNSCSAKIICLKTNATYTFANINLLTHLNISFNG